MLISNKYKFVFVHIYKNAGTSITEALAPFAANRYQFAVSNFFARAGYSWLYPQPYPLHISAIDLAEKMGEARFRSYYSFAIIRNPWDWQVSLYTFALRKKRKSRHHQMIANFSGFDEYIHWRCAEDVHFQRDFVFSKDDKQSVNFIGRYENLANDFAHICAQIGISASLPMLNVSKSRPYQTYYTDETRELVRRTFAPDIELFGYAFE